MQVVEEIASGKFDGISTASKAYGIKGTRTVKLWLSKYSREDLIAKKITISEVSELNENKQLKKRIRDLEKALDEDLIVGMVRSQRARHPRLGTRKLLHEIGPPLDRAGVNIGRDKLFELLGAKDMLVAPKRRSARTTDSRHNLPLFRNLLYNLEPTAPNQLWVADITYVDTKEGFLYLSLVTDRVSRKIVGWHAGETLEAKETMKALAMAKKQLPENRFPIHHSDRGSQYCCHDYVDELKARGLSISMTEANHCYENCYAERVNGILKDEYNLDLTFNTKEQGKTAIDEAIMTYNDYRPHFPLDLRKPSEVHAMAA